jgi:lipopolysaccharide biosynthesis protein
MNRTAIFAHYDAQDEVKRYVVFFLEKLREVTGDVRFVSTSSLPEAELDKVRPLCRSCSLRDNVGMDFGMWKHEIDGLELGGVDELVLTNSSVFGPLGALAPIVERMSASGCDLWSMTDNLELSWHLQSYFLVCKSTLLRSSAFRAFWGSMLPFRDKRQIIRSYEVGLTTFFVESGFVARAAVPVASLAERSMRWRLAGGCKGNPTIHAAADLLAAGMPFVKVELLRDNPARVRLDPVLRAMRRAGYDMSLVRFDRAPASARSGAEPAAGSGRWPVLGAFRSALGRRPGGGG